MAVLVGENGELLRERELAAPIAGLAGEVEAVEELVRSMICFANPHTVAAIVIITTLESQLHDSLCTPNGSAVPIVIVPAWQAAAQFWAPQFKTFAVLDSRGPGGLPILHRPNAAELECINPSHTSLATLLDPQWTRLEQSDYVLLGLVSESLTAATVSGSCDSAAGFTISSGITPEHLSRITDAVAAALEPVFNGLTWSSETAIK